MVRVTIKRGRGCEGKTGNPEKWKDQNQRGESLKLNPYTPRAEIMRSTGGGWVCTRFNGGQKKHCNDGTSNGKACRKRQEEKT